MNIKFNDGSGLKKHKVEFQGFWAFWIVALLILDVLGWLGRFATWFHFHIMPLIMKH